MAEYQTINPAGAGARTARIDEGLRAHMNKVYGLMSVGMLLTGGAAWAISGLATTTDPSLAAAELASGKYLTSLGVALYASPLKWVIMFAPLIMVFAFSAMINRMSAAAAQLFFYVYAAAMGLSISSIFLVYTGTSIAQTFLITAIAFAGLSLYGYTTKRDLSGMGTFLMMGLIGLIVAMVVNIFLASSAMAFAISTIGVLIFAGLTAYDTQSIKNEYVAHAAHGDQEWLGKAAIMGALRLYLDFINMFMFLLSFLGNRE
ncbi:Bax inhibitor-1 family protein [Szabonella alba]|uniref:Bax inhibitor-1/YccA family protein n=1 Tax=Szabonella alba TaxID=2804194 RepID=A0A8K0V6R2_9RHOB|nr:Bax inhibitor-1/YccA family protein [Szabonella alba]MBL4916403.1 Bax inhibitor-1/YccA family protein [Szabonella alba]